MLFGMLSVFADFERSTVVRAEGTDREHFIAAPSKKHRFAPRVAEQHGSVRDR